MNSKFKQIVAIIGAIAIIATLFPSKFMEHVSASGNPTVQPVRERGNYPVGDYKNSNMRYAVGFVYEDIWSDSSGGNWSPDPPNRTGVTITNPYTFTFSGRTVKNVNVTPFSAVSQRDTGIFYDSRGQYFDDYSPYVGSNPSVPTKSGVSGLNTSSVSLNVTMKGDLISAETYDLRSLESACGGCSPNVNGYRYYFPVMFAFELNGRMEVHYKLTDGTNIDSDFKGQSTDMGSVPVSITPETNPKYDYVGYKKSTEGSPSGGSIVSENPPTVVYDATYDIYYLNLYYEPKSTDGKIIIKHFDMAGNSLDGVAGLNNREQLLKENTPYSFTHDAPAAGSGYTYQGYKKSTSGSAPGDPLFAPPAEYNLGTYTKAAFPNTVYLYYFYDNPAAPTDGKVIIKHFDLNNNSLDGVAGLSDREAILKENTSYPFKHDVPSAGSGYTYAGYKKSTSGSTPSGTMVNADYNLGVYTRAAFPNPVQINYYYDINMAGKVNIRHMVRSGPTGTYTQQQEQVIPIASLPFSASYSPDSKYGVSKGSNLSYVSFSNTETTKMSQSVSLTPSLTGAYITFYYEMPVDFTGDFDVIDPKIPYKTTFKLHPKNFYLNGCTYISHTWRFSRDGFDWTSSPQTSQSADMTFTYANYPSVLGVGTQLVYLKITTSCGDSSWIGPKTLEMTGPANNHPPEFQIAFVSPSNPTKPLTQISEGSVLDLVVIQDPTVPTPTDPDGDTITFDGFKFAEGDAWIQSIPSKGQNHYLQYVNIPMDVRGYHSITATMHDTFGAIATASTSITIVPPNPVPIIDGPDKVVEGRPLSGPFTSDRSYSPIDGRTINHTRDEWTNVHEVYTTIGTEKITLDVYDSIGLKSLAPAQHTLTVLEDLPPIPQLEYTSPNIRNADVPFKDTSYSPDGDKLVINNVSYRYDSDNDGIYSDETLVSVTMNANKEFTFHPTRVGKYKFYVDLKEDWGKMANGVFDFEVINDAPSVNFDISSETKNPVPIIPIPLKGNALTSVGWNNSDFKTALKGSSFNYNAATGALVHSPTNFGRFSTTIAPTKNVSVVDLQPYGYYTDISSTYVRGADWDLGNGYIAKNELTGDRGSETTRIYHRDSSGTLTFIVKRDNVDLVIGVDSINQLVYTRGYNPGTSYESIATYTMASFINPSGAPSSVSYQAVINGNRIDLTNDLNRYLYLPTAFGDVMYYQVYAGINYFLGTKKLFNWGGNTPTNTKSYGYMYTSTSSIFDYVYNSYNPDLKMRYNFYTNYSYYIFNPITDGNEYSGSSPSTGNIRDDFVSTYNYLYPTYDGKYVVSSQGKVYKTSDQSRVFTLTGGTYAYDIYGVTPSNIVYGLNGTMLKGFSVNSDGSLTQKWSYTLANGVNTLTAKLADNSAGLIILERSSVSNYTVSRIDLGTGKKTVIAALNPASYTGNGNPSISLQDDGTMKVAFTASGWTAGKTRYNQTYLISSSENTSMNEALSSQNQLLNSSLHLKNMMINYKIKMNLGVGGNVFSGFSFGVQDNSNMYRVEQNAQKLQLVKVEGGHRTVIQSMPFSFKTYQTYQMKITTLDKKIKVYVDGVPMIDVFDDTFGDGQFGPFSEIPRTEFFNMSYSDLQDRSVTSKMQGVALVGQDMAYTITNDDAEKDPMIASLTEWTYNKVKEKFLDAGDGKSGPSSFSGKVYQKPVMQLDKVGVYDVTYKTVDDPNPNFLYPSSAFAEYRKPSNKAVRTLIVHRPPVVDYDVSVNADRTVKWTDRSHDPDRYLSATNYSTEATGIDYLQTKGILEKKFYYITPSGDYVATKLVTPKEAGTYTVGLAVKDEVRLVLL
ncbi:hypothetical protein GZH47_23125 [Paenibacillus rhizovicinus]|uniref:Uncharacterized protein n=1 Tax=Paenibacillus rhizovicinus TaxID=2704463 RepID=A0A6C0P4C4_9BACL|nr:hypothetical protein [Paenibacillus rhizovicinus]QHW33400.1 hypothetical protein GZH47_23125 [Paenibacillus rhizovicinus]